MWEGKKEETVKIIRGFGNPVHVFDMLLLWLEYINDAYP